MSDRPEFGLLLAMADGLEKVLRIMAQTPAIYQNQPYAHRPLIEAAVAIETESRKLRALLGEKT